MVKAACCFLEPRGCSFERVVRGHGRPSRAGDSVSGVGVRPFGAACCPGLRSGQFVSGLAPGRSRC
jgi:hypothetical protein